LLRSFLSLEEAGNLESAKDSVRYQVMVVALARKLLIALWRFVIDGLMPEGAVTKPSI